LGNPGIGGHAIEPGVVAIFSTGEIVVQRLEPMPAMLAHELLANCLPLRAASSTEISPLSIAMTISLLMSSRSAGWKYFGTDFSETL
jgi:hypothetical protein